MLKPRRVIALFLFLLMLSMVTAVPAMAAQPPEAMVGAEGDSAPAPRATVKTPTGRVIYETYDGINFSAIGIFTLVAYICARLGVADKSTAIIEGAVQAFYHVLQGNSPVVYYTANWFEYEVKIDGHFAYWEYAATVRFFSDASYTNQVAFAPNVVRQSVTQMRMPI